MADIPPNERPKGPNMDPKIRPKVSKLMSGAIPGRASNKKHANNLLIQLLKYLAIRLFAVNNHPIWGF